MIDYEKRDREFREKQLTDYKINFENILSKKLTNIFGNEFKDANLSNIDASEYVFNKIYNFVESNSHMLVYLGSPGVGKTYLCAACIHHFASKKIKELFQGRYLWIAHTGKSFLSFLKSQISNDQDLEYYMKEFCNCDLFVMDDISKPQSEWQKDMLFDLIDRRWSSNKTTIITSNLTREDFVEQFGKRFASRLFDARNTVIVLNSEDRRASL